MSGTLFDNEGNSSGLPSLLNTGPYDSISYGLSTSVATNALTISLTDASGSIPSSGTPAYINFRSGTATSGITNQRTVSSALSITIPSGTSIGHANNQAENIFVYAIDNSGTVELAVSTTPLWIETTTYDTTAISGGSSRTTLYSTTARFGVPIKYLGRLVSTQATAGTWASNMSNVSTQRNYRPSNLTEIQLTGISGYGGGASNKIFRFVTTDINTGTGATYADNATNGMTVTIVEDGLYQVQFDHDYNAAGSFTVSFNASSLTSSPAILANSEKPGIVVTSAANQHLQCGYVKRMKPGDILRAHGDGTASGANSGLSCFRLVQLIRY